MPAAEVSTTAPLSVTAAAPMSAPISVTAAALQAGHHADDVPAFAPPPPGFCDRREDIPHGRTERIAYRSTTVGTTRQAMVYLPPGYAAERSYPVLYLLHGLGGDDREWLNWIGLDRLCDNLYAAGLAVPMIVVMPNGRAMADDRAEGDNQAPERLQAFARFGDDLMNDLIPAIQARYPVIADAQHRAIAGLSAGGGQSVNIGLSHVEDFAWIGGFSYGPNTRSATELVPDPTTTNARVRLLFLACGSRDRLFSVPQRLHVDLVARQVPHLWHVDDHGHDADEWRQAFYHFAQLIFR